MLRLRARTAQREAVRALKRLGICREFSRDRLRDRMRDAWDAWLGWGIWLVAAAWFAAARWASLPRFAVVPGEWRLSSVADLVQFWSQASVTFVGLVIPFTIFLAGWVERQPQLGLALGPLARKRPVELVGYVAAVIALLGVVRAATGLRPNDDLILCDALVLAPLVALTLALRTVVFASRVLKLLSQEDAARAISDRLGREIRAHIYNDMVFRATLKVLGEECERIGVRWNALGMLSGTAGLARIAARRGGVVTDIDLSALRRLTRMVAAAAPEHGLTLLPRIGQTLEASSGELFALRLQSVAPRVARLADRCVVLRKSYEGPDVRPYLDILEHMAVNALKSADVRAFRTAIGTMLGAIDDAAERLARVGALFSPDQVSDPFSEFHCVRLVEIHLRKISRAAAMSSELDFAGQFTYDLCGMLQKAVTRGDLMTFDRFASVYVEMYYHGLRLDSPVTKDRCPRYVRDLLEDHLRPQLSKWREMDESKLAYVRNTAGMTLAAMDLLVDMARLTIESREHKELHRLCVGLSESTDRGLRMPRASRGPDALAEVIRVFDERMTALPQLYALALTGFIVGQLRDKRIDAEQARQLLEAADALQQTVDGAGRAFEGVVGLRDMPGPVRRMLEDSPDYGTRRAYSVDTTTGPTWALAVSVMRRLPLQDEHVAPPQAIPAEGVFHSAGLLSEVADQIGTDAETWAKLIGTPVAERVAAFKAWVQSCAGAYEQHERERRAAMPISEGKVSEVQSEARRRASEAGSLRPWLHTLGCVRDSPELDGTHPTRLGLATIMEKDAFTDDPRVIYANLADGFGMSMARGETQTIVNGLLGESEPLTAATLAAAIETGIQKLREHDVQPDTILVPWGSYQDCQALPGLIPAWQVNAPHPELGFIGLLGEVPVIGLQEMSVPVIVVRLAQNCMLHNIRPITLVVEPVVPNHVEAARRHYPDADELQLRTLARVVVEEKIKFEPPPAEAVAVCELPDTVPGPATG